MGSILSLLTLAHMLVGGSLRPPADTTTFADAATQALVARAMGRHRAQDSTVQSYQAKIRYRLSFALGKRAWADLPTVAVEEQDAAIAWQRPNDLRVDILGHRGASQLDNLSLTSSFSRPWFVPRALGDSIRIFGSRTPVQAAPHPLSAGSLAHYRFAAGDSLAVTISGRRITLRRVTVTPKGVGRSYVVGTLWLDVATGDVVRFTFRFVGTDLWERPDGRTAADSAEAGRTNQFISRILQIDADLEYALQDNKYWMPYRQVISGRATLPFGLDLAVPFEASTTFSDYAINRGAAVTFTAAFPAREGRGGNPPIPVARNGVSRGGARRAREDSSRSVERAGYQAGGGRYQIHRPPADSLRAYQAWGDSLSFEVADNDHQRTREATADLAHLAEGLPGRMTGRPGAGFGLVRAAEALRYNRVEGTTFSVAGRIPLPIAFTESFGTLRYGLADHRVMASLSVRRDAPASRWTVTGGRDLADLDPFVKGLTLGNGIRAALTGHDEGAYLLAQGARASYETSLGLGRELTLTALAEDERSVSTRARAGVPRLFGAQGYFGSNPSVAEGFAFGAGVRLEHGLLGSRWRVDAQMLHVAGNVAGRIAADFMVPRLMGQWLAGRILMGGAVGAEEIPQLRFRAGGLGSVRGFDYGVQQGSVNWAAQFDMTKPGKGMIKPVIFIDAGQAGRARSLGHESVLIGAGAGLALLDGLLRLEVSYPVTERAGRGLRFDLVLGAVK